jgi:TldD protein
MQRKMMISQDLASKVIAAALAKGSDLAEVYIESRETLSLQLDDERVENANSGNDIGGGVRVFSGETAAYAYTDDLSEGALLDAAQAAASAVKGASQSQVIDLEQQKSSHTFPIEKPFETVSVASKSDLLRKMDSAARGFSREITQVEIFYGEIRRRVWIYNSEGVWAEDDRNILEFMVRITAQRNGNLQVLRSGIGGRVGLELIDQDDPVKLSEEVAQSAVQMLDSRPAPAGEMTVVITNGWGGVLFHEACGHAMEADFVSKGTSAYTGLKGEQIASPLISAIDDGTLPGRRGSMLFDDEGTPASRTVLIQDGILKEYMWDLAEARRVGHHSTGNGRRQSFRHIPMPRMTNTYIDAGPHDPEEIVRSVDKGLYVKRLGGGQADIARGDFVFSVTEGYLIENGEITAPVRGATLVGNGPHVLKQIDMVGSDLELDRGMGMCGKFQSARVGVGQPTIRVPKLTVGGTDRQSSE